MAPDSRPRSGSSVIHPRLWTFYFRCVSSGFKRDAALMNTQRNNAPPLCAPLCPHPLALFTALSARHQVISSFAIAMATTALRLPRCHPLCFGAEREQKRCSGEEDQSSSVTTATGEDETSGGFLSAPNSSGSPRCQVGFMHQHLDSVCERGSLKELGVLLLQRCSRLSH